MSSAKDVFLVGPFDSDCAVEFDLDAVRLCLNKAASDEIIWHCKLGI